MGVVRQAAFECVLEALRSGLSGSGLSIGAAKDDYGDCLVLSGDSSSALAWLSFADDYVWVWVYPNGSPTPSPGLTFWYSDPVFSDDAVGHIVATLGI